MTASRFPSVPGVAVAAALGLLVVLVGCETPTLGRGITVRNETNVNLAFHALVDGQPVPLSPRVKRQGGRGMLVAADRLGEHSRLGADGCTTVPIVALDPHGEEVARVEPPLCVGDEWVVHSRAAIPSDGDGRTYDGQLLGFTIADVKALAADRGFECTPDHAFGKDVSYFCTTSTPELDTPMWLRLTGHAWGEEAYNLSVFASTAPPDEPAGRDAVADIVEALMPWIADLGWYRSGDFDCRAGRQGDREFDNFGPEYSICAISSADLGGDGSRSLTELDIATEP